MGFKTTNKQVVEEVPWGVYVWKCPDGEILGDADGNLMNIYCMKNDLQALAAIRDAARHYGYPEGEPVWLTGRRRITDDEYEEQVARQNAGLTPDPDDVGELRDEFKNMNIRARGQ